MSVADRSRIGFWVVHRITWNAGELGSEIGWDQGDRTVAKSTEKILYKKRRAWEDMMPQLLQLGSSVIAAGYLKPH